MEEKNNGLLKNLFSNDVYKKEVNEFAVKQGYKGAKYIGNWKKYRVYEPHMANNEISFTGLPLVILVNEQGEIRMSTSDEAMATLDDKNFMDSFEETNNIDNNKMDQNVINDVINNIDNKIKELESQQNNDISNSNEVEINKRIEENLEDVRHFSILNKSEDELYLAKNKFINDWYYLLTNQVDEHWVMNSATYRVHIQSIVEALLRRNDEEKTRKQLEYLKQAIECIETQNRAILIKIVVDMKTMEEFV